MAEDIVEQDETTIEVTPERRAATTVKRDFEEAREYLNKFHKHCNDMWAHYIAPSQQSNPHKDKTFPVPFVTEQCDQFVADCYEKLFYKDEPCSIYGRNDTDKADADAKRSFIKYQDKQDEIKDKIRMALLHCALYRIAPAVVNYKEEFIEQEVIEETPVVIDGMPILDIDGATPITIPMPTIKEIPTYQGATVELVDPLDFFWTKEKRQIYDHAPLMVRSQKTMDWFEDQSYILPAGIQELKVRNEADSGVDYEGKDLLDDRREMSGFDSQGMSRDAYTYVEWQGWFSPERGGQKKLYIIGWIEGTDICMRLQDMEEIFGLGHPNIIVGVIGKTYGEIYGPSLVDKFHSVAHGMDAMMGIWLAGLRQTSNNMWAVNKNNLITTDLKNEPGFVIECRDDPGKAIQRLEPQQISQDVYAGMEMMRQMGQNASGLNEISGGKVQEGVETLGEATILTNQSAQRAKGGYLACFETSLVQPMYEMRNSVNMKFVQDPGYLYSVIEDQIMNWREATPAQIRTAVDFVCEASNRENQRAVVTQQIVSALGIVQGMVEFIGPIPAIKLLQMLYEEGFGWKQDKIMELLPPELMVQELMKREMLQQQEQQMQQQAAQAKGGGGGPQSKPRSDADVAENTNAANRPQVGEMG